MPGRAPGHAEPRPAYPPQAHQPASAYNNNASHINAHQGQYAQSYQDPYVHQPQPPHTHYNPPNQVYSPQPQAQAQTVRPASAELDALHRSLEQLSRKIATLPQPDPAASKMQIDRVVAEQRAQQGNAINQMRDQFVTELRAGISGVREDFGRTAQGIQSGVTNSLSLELQRIADGIAALQDGSTVHPDYIDQMQAELGNLNSGISQLLDRPASQVDLSGVTRAIESNYSDLVSRLDLALTQRGNEMPVIDIPNYSDQFTRINSRLEEMTRAVVSMTVNPDNTTEHHALERIEARLASLSKSVDELMEDGPPGMGNPQIEVDSIASQIARLSEKLDNLDAMGAAGDALGQEIFPDVRDIAARIDSLQNDVGLIAASLEKGVSISAPSMPAQIHPAPQQADQEILGAIEEHLGMLAGRIDDLAAGSGENPNASGQEILSVLRDLVGRIEGLEQIAAGEMEAVADDGTHPRFDALESHLAEITRQLGGIAAPSIAHVDMAPITERLDHIEGQIATSRDIVIDIATEAAQRAVAAGGGQEGGGEAIAAMLEEIRAMRAEQGAMATGYAQNTGYNPADDQLAEIGSTMSGIAERLAQIESSFNSQSYRQAEAAPRTHYEAAAQATRGMSPVMSHEPDFDLSTARSEQVRTIDDAPSIDMAEDAAFADMHATSAYNDRMQHTAVIGEDPHADHPHGSHHHVEMEDVPLAPGSGMPDLETLVERATRKKKARDGNPDDTGKASDDGLSDLMAAARRAAQAASREAETVRDAEPKKKRKLSIGGKLPGLSKPGLPGKKALMMSAAAIIVIAGGLLASQSLFGSGGGNPDDSGFEAMVDPAVSEEVLQDDGDGSTDQTDARVIDMAEMEAEETGGNIESADADGLVDPMSPAGSEEAVESDVGEMLANGDESAARSASLSTGELPAEELGNLAYRQAVASGNPDALFEAGRRYTEGQIVPRDLSEAVVWYTRAAEAGHAPAQYRLGNFFEKGHGVEANPSEAVKWYSMSAEQGNALAMHNLGVLNAQGVVSGDADMPAAIEWFEKAANLGVKDSQVNLGILYTKGMGVQEDLVRAYKWFAIAAKGGDADAAKKRDTVAQAMRPEQLETARGEAEIWKPVQLDATANIARVSDEWQAQGAGATLTKTEMVRMAQELLAKAGFDAGPADGMMGEKTRNAIAAFQEANGLAIDGTVSPELIDALGKVNI